MIKYLVDFYSAEGTLFRSERLVATDDNQAGAVSKSLVPMARVAFYKITRLEKSGNLIIHCSKSSHPAS